MSFPESLSKPTTPNLRISAFLLVASIFLTLCSSGANAQPYSAEKEFQVRFDEWRQIIIDLQMARQEYRLADTFQDSVIWREKYDAARKAGDEKISEIKIAAAKAFFANPKRGTDAHKFLVRSLETDLMHQGDLVGAFVSAKALAKQPSLVTDDRLKYLVGITLFNNQEFDAAKPFLVAKKDEEMAASNNVDPALLNKFVKLIPKLKSAWEKELEFREKDKTANLPRAIIETAKGQIIVELFEDQAPNTVKNFVFLAERQFFDGLDFFLVRPFEFAASGSRINEMKDSGRGITNEALDPAKRRGGFRGTLSAVGLERRIELDGGGVQYERPFCDAELFIIQLAPREKKTEDEFCNFGRVIAGLKVLDSLNRSVGQDGKPVEDFKADKILKVTIENKRDHDYIPHLADPNK